MQFKEGPREPKEMYVISKQDCEGLNTGFDFVGTILLQDFVSECPMLRMIA
jgi:hypothetical protein